MSRRFGTTDRRRIIDWLKSEDNIGGVTEFKTEIDQKLIDGVKKRISQLEKAEDRLDNWKAIEFGLDD